MSRTLCGTVVNRTCRSSRQRVFRAPERAADLAAREQGKRPEHAAPSHPHGERAQPGVGRIGNAVDRADGENSDPTAEAGTARLQLRAPSFVASASDRGMRCRWVPGGAKTFAGDSRSQEGIVGKEY